MEPTPKLSRSRQSVFDALRIAAPSTFTEKMRGSFLAGGLNVRLADLELDSLAQMEFCIAIELATGVTLVPSQLSELGCTDAIERRINEALGT
jgi:hypothetical protein